MLLHLIPGKATAPSDDDDEEEKDNGKDYIVHCADEIGPSQLDNAPQPSQPTQQYNTCYFPSHSQKRGASLTMCLPSTPWHQRPLEAGGEVASRGENSDSSRDPPPASPDSIARAITAGPSILDIGCDEQTGSPGGKVGAVDQRRRNGNQGGGGGGEPLGDCCLQPHRGAGWQDGGDVLCVVGSGCRVGEDRRGGEGS
uniref:Uncharacterized protein n=1 Tax=Oryza barthii TaxID=65489 RepID=A0A0D3FM98_9ORYZ